MITQDKKDYIITNCRNMTLEELSGVCSWSKVYISKILRRMGYRAITDHERKVNTIREANGQKTAKQLAGMAGCSTQVVYDICQKYDIPYLQEEVQPGHYIRVVEDEWSEENRRKLLETEIAKHMAKGLSRLQALQAIEEVADWLINLKDNKAMIERPKAVYSNPTHDQLIDKILNS